MALPANGTAWPPAELAPILAKYREYGAWYGNDVATLTDIYTRQAQNTTRHGVISRLRTWFLGAKTNGQVEANSIHVSLAQEICRTSANLLYSEPAKATVVPPTEGEPVDKIQERLDLIAGPEFEQLSISAGEISAALGGVFKRITWDTSIKDHVFITKVDADSAWPEFNAGTLTAVTFWRVVGRDNTTVWRLLERHEVRNKIGVIVYGLYQGTDVNLGQAQSFDAHESTAWLLRPDTVTQLLDGNTVSTLTPGLGAVYAPNILPSSLWRNDPLGSNLGRSDLEGIEQKLDALDELYSAWLRDIRLGKGRLIVPESFLTDFGVGKGAGFDLDQTLFSPVKTPPGSAASASMQLEKVQFDIRTDDFLKAIDHFRRIILAAAGYSPSTFGLTDDGGAMTATEVAARQQLSFTTRKRKVLGVKPADEAILTKALATDAAVFPAGGAKPYKVTVEFPDGIGDDPKAIAETNQLDYNSQSASIEERVRKRNPDWDDVKVADEVALIRAENSLPPLEDPATFGTDGAGIAPQPFPTPTG